MQALLKFAKAGTIDPFIAALKDEHWQVRRGAARILGKLRDVRAIDPLVAALGATMPYSYWALVKIGDPAVGSLITALQDGSVRECATRALSRIGISAVDSLLATLKDSNSKVRQASVWTLGKIGDTRAVESLIAVLDDSEYFVRKHAIRALGKIRDARAVQSLIALHKDDNIQIWWSAAIALSKIGAPAVAPLLALIRENADSSVLRPAVDALCEIEDAHAVEPLIAALKDDDWVVREAAVKALGKIGNARTVRPLIVALLDSRLEVRGVAQDALERMDDPIPILIATLNHSIEFLGNWVVREHLAERRENIGDADARRGVTVSYKGVPLHVGKNLDAMRAFAALYEDTYAKVRNAVAEELKQIYAQIEK